jgi:Spy/CpxP family protein refolding chaperone
MKVLLAGLGVIVVAGAALAAAQGVPGGRREGRPDGVAMEKQLGLSDEQATQMRKLWSTERKTGIRRHADIAIARMELDEALSAPTVDEKLVAAKVRALTELQAAAVQARADQRIAVRKLLTPEQQAKLTQLRREHRGDRGDSQRGGRRFGPGRRGGPMGPNEGPVAPAPEPDSEE